MYGYVGDSNGWVDILGLDCGKVKSKGRNTPAWKAKRWQGSGDYPGVDKWETIIMKKGDVVWGGEPGQGYFYTSQATISKFGNDATKIFQSLQVGKGSYPTYRKGMTKYIVNQDIKVGRGKALANPQHGLGGGDQFFIENFEDVLDAKYTLILENL